MVPPVRFRRPSLPPLPTRPLDVSWCRRRQTDVDPHLEGGKSETVKRHRRRLGRSLRSINTRRSARVVDEYVGSASFWRILASTTDR